jgi:Tfp pilus assembly protein PilV
MRAARKTTSAGFTLLELTTAMFVLVLGLFGVFQLFYFGLDRMRSLDEAAIASQALQNELEAIRATPTAMTDGEHAFVTRDPALERLQPAETKVSVAPAAKGTPGLKQVDLSIRWITHKGFQAERSLTTLMEGAAP